MKKRILVAPLNWGLGHATRCIPLIKALLKYDFTPIIASDGAALELLIKEFPELEAVHLPSYDVNYSKKGYTLKLKLLVATPKFLNSMKTERRATHHIVKTYRIDGIISDNRFGVYHEGVPSVYLTHQLNVPSGNTTWLSSFLHQRIIKNFNECWVPDVSGKTNLSGKMGHLNHAAFNIKYIGPLNRFQKKSNPIKFDVLVLLSGPEPQRTLLEKKLLAEFKCYSGKVLFVKGVIAQKQTLQKIGNMKVYNFMVGTMLEDSLNNSELVISRSGYTTIMELSNLEKKAFFIPTPGQREQIYLAEKMKSEKFADFCHQNSFSISKLDRLSDYTGLKRLEIKVDFEDLFDLFKRK